MASTIETTTSRFGMLHTHIPVMKIRSKRALKKSLKPEVGASHP